jgi:hypothetical protein
LKSWTQIRSCSQICSSRLKNNPPRLQWLVRFLAEECLVKILRRCRPSIYQSPVGEMRRQWTLFSPSDSYTGCSKRPRTLGYTIEDAKRACHRYISAIATESQSDLNFSESQSENAGCSKGPRIVGSNENLPKNISAVATESQSVSPVSSSVKNNSNSAEKQQEQVISVSNWTLNGPSERCSTSKEEQNGEKFQ